MVRRLFMGRVETWGVRNSCAGHVFWFWAAHTGHPACFSKGSFDVIKWAAMESGNPTA